MENNEIKIKDQTQEYVDRGYDLQKMSYLDFFLETYHRDCIAKVTSDSAVSGMKCSQRSPYRPNCGRDDKCRVFRRAGHETLPEFVGRWFPRRDIEGSEDIFSAWMLTLLKPWREIVDILGEKEQHTLHHIFLEFEQSTSSRNQAIIKNIQYVYECMDSAEKRNDVQSKGSLITFEEIPDEHVDDNGVIMPVQYTQENLDRALNPKISKAEELYTVVGMAIAEDAGIFGKDTKIKGPFHKPKIASLENIGHYQALEGAVKNIKRKDTMDHEFFHSSTPPAENVSFSGPSNNIRNSYFSPTSSNSSDAESYLSHLNSEQRRAHDIVAVSLDAHLEGKRPRQILMIVIGAGGTGKSALLNAITKTFEARHSRHLLAKTALSGVAATVIGGTTLHWWGGLPTRISGASNDWVDRKSTSKDIKTRREQNIVNTLWLAIDEISMLTAETLTHTSQVTGFVKTGAGQIDSSILFGGMNVILLGDFHQFPPVANPRAALYSSPASSKSESSARLMGRNIFSQFETVVTLTEQMRITDGEWMSILGRARTGDCSSSDLQKIRKLVLSDTKCDIPDFGTPPWSNAVLVTPRNVMREKWNAAALRKHCQKNHEVLFVCQAEDKVGKNRHEPTLEEMTIIAGVDPEEELRKLHTRTEIAIGMKAMVTVNIATEADLANGTRGIITDIILDPREILERSEVEDGVVTLVHPPAMIVFKPLVSSFPKFGGLAEGEIPLFPAEHTFKINTSAIQKVLVNRRQYNLTGGYAFTLYKAQGQTLS